MDYANTVGFLDIVVANGGLTGFWEALQRARSGVVNRQGRIAALRDPTGQPPRLFIPADELEAIPVGP